MHTSKQSNTGLWLSLTLTPLSGLYTYWVTWGSDKGFRSFDNLSDFLLLYLSCGTIFGMLTVYLLLGTFRTWRMVPIVAISAMMYPLAVLSGAELAMDLLDVIERMFWPSGTWRLLVDPEIISVAITGAFSSGLLAILIYFVAYGDWAGKRLILQTVLSGGTGGGLIGMAIVSASGNTFGHDTFHASPKLSILGYEIWQIGFVLSVVCQQMRNGANNRKITDE